MKTIYEYTDPNLFLREKWASLKLKRPELSVRSLSNFLELKSHGPLHQMIQGKRKIGQSYIPKLVQYLQLTDKEGLYFDILVKFSRAQSVVEKNFYLDTLKDLKPKNLPTTEVVSNFEVLKNPLHFFILELAYMGQLQNNYQAIKKKLLVSCTSFEVKAAVALLLESGFLNLDANNVLTKTHKHLFSTQDIKDLAIVQYHQKNSTAAYSAIENQDVLIREFVGSAFNISKDSMVSIKKDIRDFLLKTIEKYESPSGEGDATYQLNLQFFKVAER